MEYRAMAYIKGIFDKLSLEESQRVFGWLELLISQKEVAGQKEEEVDEEPWE